MSTGSPDFKQAEDEALAEWEAMLAAERQPASAPAVEATAPAVEPIRPEPVRTADRAPRPPLPDIEVTPVAAETIRRPAPAVEATEVPVAPVVETTPALETATPVAETGPVPAPTAEETERVNRENILNERLAEARKQYLTKKLEWERSRGLLQSTFVQNAESRAQLQQSLDAVEAEYEAAFAEFKAVNVEKAMDESLRIAEQKARIISGEAGPKRLTAWYKKLGETSVLGTANYEGPFKRTVKFATSYRTLLNAALIGGAVLAGPGGWVAGGAFVGRRLLSGFGAGVGTMDLVKTARMKYLQKELGPESSLSDIDNQLESLLARAALDGTVDKLEGTEHYRDLLARREEASRRKFAESTPEEKHGSISILMTAKDTFINAKIDQEKKWNKKALAAGIAAGAFVGSGKLMDLLKSGAGAFNLKWPNLGIKDWFSQEDALPNVARPNLEHLQPAGPTAPLAPEVAGAGIVAGETALAVGNRGIEGALLDHLKTPEGAKMMEWLQAQGYNQGITDKGALVHRFVSHYAEEKGFNIDQGGGNDLSKIFGAEVKVSGDGAIQIGGEKFMPGTNPDAIAEKPDVHAPEEINADIQPSADIDSPETALGNVDSPVPMEEPELAAKGPGSAPIEGEAPDTEPEPAPKKLTQLEEGRFEAALSQEKASNALQLILNKDYPRFLKHMELSGGDLDKVRNLKYSEFLEKCSASESFKDKYGKLAELLRQEVKPQLQSVNVKRLLVAIARNKQEQGLV